MKRDYFIHEDSTVIIQLQILDFDRTPIDLDRADLRCSFALTTDSETLDTLTIGDGIRILDGPTAIVEIKYNPNITENYVDNIIYQVRVTVQPSGDTWFPLSGKIYLTPSIVEV